MSEYTAITKNALIENTNIEFDLYLKSGSNGHSNYVLFSRGDELFSPERRDELLSRNAQNLYISATDIDKYLKYQEENLRHIIEDNTRSSLQKSGVLYQVAKNVAKELLYNPRAGQHIERVSTWVNNTIQHILENENTFFTLLKIITRDYRLYTHCVNTSVIGLLFGSYLSLKPEELNSLGTGLLLHDIGKVTVPLAVINKRGKLTVNEFTEMKKHPKAGLEILGHSGSVDTLLSKIIIQHHENNDGTGYPYGIEGSDIHLFGHISRIIDVYDAMTTDRPYAFAEKPFAVLEEMKNKMSNCFDAELLREFICFLGPKELRKKPGAKDVSYSVPSGRVVLCDQKAGK
jgi:HD-GYP domain-containing protein (c-di-GMP phosphodiesterase class II)